MNKVKLIGSIIFLIIVFWSFITKGINTFNPFTIGITGIAVLTIIFELNNKKR